MEETGSPVVYTSLRESVFPVKQMTRWLCLEYIQRIFRYRRGEASVRGVKGAKLKSTKQVENLLEIVGLGLMGF